MKKILFLSLFITPVLGFCGDKNSLSGNWKEVSRKKSAKEPISYTDTIMIKFLTGNEYVWQKAGGFIYRGTYKIENNSLDMGARQFLITERKPNKLVLRDDAGIYEFAPYTEPKTGNAPVHQEVNAPVNSIQQMAGQWSVYKGTSDKKKESIDYSRQVKSVEIFPSEKDGTWGNVYSRRDADNAPSWVIKSYSNQTLYCEGKDNRQFKVIKCQDNDLIMESEGTTYFFRQFK
ncbi:MAG: hypothetical protein BGO70_00675 [Bacteroidetes bacterium 43-93]|nr:hypothetical protein [Bacteroidota bacterium]OJW96233.1 MAG: hypothetical protein BGO70_00675 [Bacteroidetes bacterium 43-93]